MKKTKIIKEIVGERLKEHGFSFQEMDGVCWEFVREAHGFKRYYDPETDVVKQYVTIQEHRFAKDLTVRFHTDASNQLNGKELDALVELNPLKTEWYPYLDEEGYKKTLNQLTDIIIDHGLDFLQQKSVEEEITPTKAMATELFEDHRELDERFTRKYGMNPVPQSASDIEGWFRKLKQMIMEAAERPYEEVKELFVEMAAFIGERNCEILGAKWFFEEEFKTPRTQGDNYQGFGFLPLREVVACYRRYKEDREHARTELWFGNEINELKKAFQRRSN